MRVLLVFNATVIATLVALVQRGMIRSYPDVMLGSLALLVIDGVLLFRRRGVSTDTATRAQTECRRRAITGTAMRLSVGIAACTFGAIVLRDRRYLIVAGVGGLILAVVFLVRRFAN